MSKKVPEGVTVSHDDGNKMQDRVKWLMTRMISGDTPEADADLVLETLLRPFAERYCDTFDEGADIVICARQYEKNIDMGHEAPHALLGRYRDMWKMFREELVSHFESFYDVECTFTATYDQMFGGPILTVDEDDCSIVYVVAFPERFGKGD